MEKKDEKEKKVCHSDKEFEELFLPGLARTKKMQQAINDPKKLKEHLKENLLKHKKDT
jgi:hypothetical protein